MLARLFVLLIIISFAGCTSGGTPSPTPAPTTAPPTPKAPAVTVEAGDLVWIQYTGRVQGTGEVFDTTYQEIGTDDSINKTEIFPLSIVQSMDAHYGPLGLIVGKGQTLMALENTLIGMGIGEEKSITIPPKDAYGARKSEYVVSYPRKQEFPIEVEVPLKDYIDGVGKEPSRGDTVPATPYWDAVVTDVTGNTVRMVQMAEDGKEVNTIYGPGVIHTTDSTIEILFNPEVGSYVQTNIGTARVVSVGETEMVFDFNHPLAGKTLVFDIKIENITKKDSFSDWEIQWSGYEEGLERGAQEGKPIMMDLYWSKCPHCQRMDEETFPDPRVTALKDDFVWVREEVKEERTDLAEKYGVDSFPTLVILDSQGKEIKRLNGFMNAMVLRWELEAVLDSLG